LPVLASLWVWGIPVAMTLGNMRENGVRSLSIKK